ncbi:MAG: hypothetical protein RMY64_23225 [Nostoc sp. DedQUE08]|nr:hypothetical protein [Nostoc sp. DedQUE08]
MERIGTKGVCSEADGIERFNYSGSQLYGIQTQPLAFPHKATGVYTNPKIFA